MPVALEENEYCDSEWEIKCPGEHQCGSLVFVLPADSGNLAKVQEIYRPYLDKKKQTKPWFDYAYNVWTQPDCFRTAFENSYRTWFYFGVKGYVPKANIQVTIVNLNKQVKLYSHGYRHVVKVIPGSKGWERLKGVHSFSEVANGLAVTFSHRFSSHDNATTYFAFCYPWSYEECQQRLNELDAKYAYCQHLPSELFRTPLNTVYYHRELLCHSLDGHRVDMITISSYHGITHEEPRFDSLLFPDVGTQRCRHFANKQVFILTARVHPGETPASHAFNGFLEFILRRTDKRAQQLRKQYIFKLIPMVNPDGVVRGHYRMDSRGANLNRMYINPTFELHPSIYAVMSLIIFHHVFNSTNSEDSSNLLLKLYSLTIAHYHRCEETVTSGASLKPSSKKASASYCKKATSSSSWEEQQKSEVSASSNEHMTAHEVTSRTADKLLSNEETRGNTSAACITEGLESKSPLRSSQSHNANRGGACVNPDPALLSIPHMESGIAFYIDLHAIATRHGCFFYGNHYNDEKKMVRNAQYPKLVAMNTAHLSFDACNFAEEGMHWTDKDGFSKDGCGRVAVAGAIGIANSYTLECGFHTSKSCTAALLSEADRTPHSMPHQQPVYYEEKHYADVGRALAIAALDMTDTNPRSRINSPYTELCGLLAIREWTQQYLRRVAKIVAGRSS